MENPKMNQGPEVVKSQAEILAMEEIESAKNLEKALKRVDDIVKNCKGRVVGAHKSCKGEEIGGPGYPDQVCLYLFNEPGGEKIAIDAMANKNFDPLWDDQRRWRGEPDDGEEYIGDQLIGGSIKNFKHREYFVWIDDETRPGNISSKKLRESDYYKLRDHIDRVLKQHYYYKDEGGKSVPREVEGDPRPQYRKIPEDLKGKINEARIKS